MCGFGISSLGTFYLSFGMTHLGCDEVNSTHAVGKAFPLMTRKHGLVILKKQSTSSLHTNNVTYIWSQAKVSMNRTQQRECQKPLGFSWQSWTPDLNKGNDLPALQRWKLRGFPLVLLHITGPGLPA